VPKLINPTIPLEQQVRACGGGTGFIVRKNGHYFFITAYHLFSGRLAWDTTMAATNLSNLLPSFALINYRRRSGALDTIGIELKDNNGGNVFFSLPPMPGSRSVVDVACVRLIDGFPEVTKVDFIDFDRLDTNWSIAPFSKLIVYGYRGITEPTSALPIPDTVITEDESFNYNDSFIFAKRSIPFGGASGAPVYYNHDGVNTFVGMVSTEILCGSAFYLMFELRGRKSHQLLYEFVSAKTVNRLIDALLF